MQQVLPVLVVVALIAWLLGRTRALKLVGGHRLKLHSLPTHYGYYAMIWSVLPALALTSFWSALTPALVTKQLVNEMPAAIQALPSDRLSLFLNDVYNRMEGKAVAGNQGEIMQFAAQRLNELQIEYRRIQWSLCIALVVGGLTWSWWSINPVRKARNSVERVIVTLLAGSSMIAILTTVGIVLSVLFESIRFFQAVPVSEFLFGLEWNPQTAIRVDQVAASGAFGAAPLFAGTLLVSFIAMAVAAPVGLMSAIYLSEYATPRSRAVLKPLLEILAGIPTVVYGFFAALVIAPMIRNGGTMLGLDVASESALAAGLVMGVMIIPFVSSLTDDIITAVPRDLREGAYALGATQSETILSVLLPAALPGIVGGLLLAISRAIGETMIVVMAAGLSANLTANPLQAVTTVTVQIVTLLVGDQEFDSPKTLAAFALGLVLFLITLLLNIIALHVVKKYREQYD